MDNITDRITELIKKRLNSQSSNAEEEELMEWISQSESNRLAVAAFLSEDTLKSGIKEINQSKERIWQRLDAQINAQKVIPMRSNYLIKYAVAAAAIFIILFGGGYFLLNRNAKKEFAIAKANQLIISDVLPGSIKAVLTLDDGSKVVLDSIAASSQLTKQGNTLVLNKKGELVYDNEGGAQQGEMLYNTLSTAFGETYALVLSDGSKVWLNSASSIRFPVAFSGNQRNVEITGEAYFEVAKNAAKPFKVSIKKSNGTVGEVEVLGTHFNINAYDDEPDVKATLLEGSVKVKKADAIQMLSPGEQANLTASGIGLQKNIDLSQVVAWKNGFFWFDNTDLQTIMRQIARWYDVKVTFTGKLQNRGFSGKISRSVPLSKFLKVLDLNNIHVKIEGKEMFVSP